MKNKHQSVRTIAKPGLWNNHRDQTMREGGQGRLMNKAEVLLCDGQLNWQVKRQARTDLVALD